MEEFEKIKSMSPIKAYTYGYEESKAETIASFWQIIENLYNEGKIGEAVVKRFVTIKTI